MALWRIRPVADPGDSRWQDHPIYDNVVVRADTAALARLAAARMEMSRIGTEPPTGNESPSRFSAFEDEKLYQVQPLSDDGAASNDDPAGSPVVLSCELRRAGSRA